MPVAVTAIQKKSGMLATSWLRDDRPAVDLTETFTVSRPSTTCFYLEVEAAPEVLSKPRLKLSSMAPWMRPCEGRQSISRTRGMEAWFLASIRVRAAHLIYLACIPYMYDVSTVHIITTGGAILIQRSGQSFIEAPTAGTQKSCSLLAMVMIMMLACSSWRVPIGGNARAGTVAGHDGNAMQ